MSTSPGNFGVIVSTPYGEARVNSTGRILWAEWEVWRHSEKLVKTGLWTMKRRGYGDRERVEFYAVEHQGVRAPAAEKDAR